VDAAAPVFRLALSASLTLVLALAKVSRQEPRRLKAHWHYLGYTPSRPVSPPFAASGAETKSVQYGLPPQANRASV